MATLFLAADVSRGRATRLCWGHVGRRFWDKIVAQDRGCYARPKDIVQEETDAQFGVRLFDVLFCHIL